MTQGQNLKSRIVSCGDALLHLHNPHMFFRSEAVENIVDDSHAVQIPTECRKLFGLGLMSRRFTKNSFEVCLELVK